MSSFLLPKIGCNLSSAMISRLFSGFWSLFFLMCAHIFFVTSLRGSGSVPTIFESSADGVMGFMNALFFVALPASFAMSLSGLRIELNQSNSNGIGRDVPNRECLEDSYCNPVIHRDYART